MIRRAGSTVGRLWAASRPLTALGLGLLPVLALAAAGVAVDGRVVNGEPAWLKPAKFAGSIATYCLTLAWFFALTGRPSRFLRAMGTVVAGSLALEMAIIAVQAGRGTTSHFNVGTPLDAALFQAMGLAIVALLGASAGAAAGLIRATFPDPAVGWAVRLGMAVTVLGATTGGLMIRSTAAQEAAARAGGVTPTVGAHSVGGADGATGALPLVGWSRTHGDLRAPHFAGLHAMQAIPIVALLALRTIRPASDRARLGLIATVAAGYLGLIVLLTAQALGGRSVAAPDAADSLRLAGLAGAMLVVGAALIGGDRARAPIPAFR